MKLTDDEVILFGAMMYAAGLNEKRGNPVSTLEKLSADDFRRGKGVAAREFPVFKRETKKRRTN